jgi:glycosyltransferase involved in cell wall biosynthesis
LAWLPGARDDVPEWLRTLDLFVLPSQAEGISNTILEAMACGLPVVATKVGGNAELVVEGETGRLVPASDPDALALAIRESVEDAERLCAQGEAGRWRVEERFSMEAMVAAYLKVYDAVLKTPLAP